MRIPELIESVESMDEESKGKPVKILATSAVDGTGMEVLARELAKIMPKVVGMRTSVSQHRVRARTPVDVCIDSIIEEQVLCYQLTCTYRLFC